MALVVPQDSLVDCLSAWISSVLNSCKIRLFVSNITPGSSTTLASLLAAEATFSGYSPVLLTTWSAPTIGGSGGADTLCTQPSFTGTALGGTGNLYGYFLTNSGGTVYYGAERFASAPLSFAQNTPFNFDVKYTFISQS